MPHAAAIGTRLDGSPLVVLLDIDGTLAPIAPRPEDARIPAATVAVLRGVIELPHTVVALVTGRSADDARRMAVAGAWIIGNHGLELQSPDGETTPNPDAAGYADAVAVAARALAPLQQELAGVILEDKKLGLGVHYRLARPEALPRIRARLDDVARSTGLRLTEGKKILELRPPVASGQGNGDARVPRAGWRAYLGSVGPVRGRRPHRRRRVPGAARALVTRCHRPGARRRRRSSADGRGAEPRVAGGSSRAACLAASSDGWR